MDIRCPLIKRQVNSWEVCDSLANPLFLSSAESAQILRHRQASASIRPSPDSAIAPCYCFVRSTISTAVRNTFRARQAANRRRTVPCNDFFPANQVRLSSSVEC